MRRAGPAGLLRGSQNGAKLGGIHLPLPRFISPAAALVCSSTLDFQGSASGESGFCAAKGHLWTAAAFVPIPARYESTILATRTHIHACSDPWIVQVPCVIQLRSPFTPRMVLASALDDTKPDFNFYGNTYNLLIQLHVPSPSPGNTPQGAVYVYLLQFPPLTCFLWLCLGLRIEKTAN